MSSRPVVPRERARRDMEEAVDHYVRESGEAVAVRFIDAVEAAFRLIARHPAGGSPRYAHELNLVGLRSLTVKRYPSLVFYVEREDLIDVWRVLHARRDIPAWMHGDA